MKRWKLVVRHNGVLLYHGRYTRYSTACRMRDYFREFLDCSEIRIYPLVNRGIFC